MGQTDYDVVKANAFIGSQFLTQGKQFFVKPSTGSDGNDGRSPRRAFQTLSKALSAATANQNDVVWFFGEGNSSASCTDYQSATLDWNKDLVHLIGVNAGGHLSQRSRVAYVSTYTGAGPLFTVSANGCRIQNVSFYAGVASANPKGCVKVTGDRNHFVNCHIAGIGDNTMDTANAYSLWLSGADESLFENCEIGLDTVAAGSAANRDLYVDAQSARNKFLGCTLRRLVEHASNHPLVELADATSIDRDLSFVNCNFLQFSTNYAIAAGQVMKIPALTQGYVIVVNGYANSSNNSTAPKWDVNDADKISVINSPTPAADTCGIGRQV